MAVLDTIKAYVNLVNKKLTYVETTSTSYVFDLVGYRLPVTIMDKNMNKPLKERTPIILLDINQQNIGMHDYSVMNHSNSVRFTLPRENFPILYADEARTIIVPYIDENDDLQVTGTFQK
jgi:hypothetical protein